MADMILHSETAALAYAGRRIWQPDFVNFQAANTAKQNARFLSFFQFGNERFDIYIDFSISSS